MRQTADSFSFFSPSSQLYIPGCDESSVTTEPFTHGNLKRRDFKDKIKWWAVYEHKLVALDEGPCMKYISYSGL